MQIVVIILALLVLAATGVGYLQAATGPTNYSCMNLSHQGSNVLLRTSGLIHYVKSQYYVTCTEGSSLPTTGTTYSCLAITPQALTAPIGVGATTYYYYLSASGHSITLQGAPAPTNNTEIITPSAVSLLVNC